MAPLSRTQVSTNRAHVVQKQAASASQELTAAQGKVEAGQKKLNEIVVKLTQTARDIEKLSANPKKNAAQLKELKSQQEGLGYALTVQTELVFSSGQQLHAAKEKLTAAESTALKSAKTANTAAEVENKALPFPKANFVDSLDDAASLSINDQRELLGAATTFSAADALKTDVNRLTAAVMAGNGPAMLGNLVRGTDPANQAALLEAVKAQLPAIAKQAFATTGFAEKGAAPYLQAMDQATPAARAMMVKALADAAPAGALDGTGVGRALNNSGLLDDGLLANGEGFGGALELMTALKAAGKTRASDSVARFSASAISDLRADFNKSAKVTQKLKGELAMLNNGFGPLMDDAQKTKAINAFKAQHASEFAEVEKAGAKLSSALDAIKSLDVKVGPKTAGEMKSAADLVKKHGLAGPNGEADTGMVLLQDEALKLAALLPELSELKTGGEAVRAALIKQREGEPSWLDSATKIVGGPKDLTEGVAKVVASGIGQLALRGDVLTKDSLINLLSKNAKVLGVGSSQIDELTDAFMSTGKESTDKLKTAFNKIEGGEFGSTKTQQTALKSIGLALSLYSTAKGVADWEEGNALDHAKTITAAAKLGVDGSSLVLGMMGKEAVLKNLSKLGGGLNVVAGALDIVSGIQGIRDGKIAEGTADVMSGAGGVLMAAAAMSESIPGGQLPGAVLALAGLVTKLVVGHRAAGEAERAAEKDAKAYLVGGGIPEKMAAELGNVRRDDHTNVGQAIIQLAPHLKTTPKELFAFLLKQTPAKLDQFVQMALDLTHDDDMKIAEKNGASGAFNHDSAEIRVQPIDNKAGAPTLDIRPRSLTTAALWMKANELDPNMPVKK